MWDELAERFRNCNGPQLYQLQREISLITQDNQIVSQYFTKLKKLWDKLQCSMPLPQYTCGVIREVADHNSSTKLMQFLIGLNESYDGVQNQILMLDPLPNINKAYSIVLRVEKQKEVQIWITDVIGNAKMLVHGQNYKMRK